MNIVICDDYVYGKRHQPSLTYAALGSALTKQINANYKTMNALYATVSRTAGVLNFDRCKL
jgi:hypothetical protein